ncbi:unnamed protein product [Orchesella dallaii]|uniref:Fanconi anemia group M protein n=1 Tax=Orchesella dallaii TaxID=48710 RepID=A0ABP1QZU6_9HEXA
MNGTKDGRGGSGQGRNRESDRGRGRDRGDGFVPHVMTTLGDDDDDRNMAVTQFGRESNSLTKSFEELNTASELQGFDTISGRIWVYPTNRPERDYQFKIVETALFHNTLVSLPTGLGKTFISAVVMYNFQRWYPRGLVIFMAPTRPLVTQQLDACHNTVGISPSKTVELTGQITPPKREKLWNEKTVFFLTPQVLLSDLERGFFRAEDVRLIVVDEAHKATGNHAYTQVISKISEKNPLFRVLALSATPGSDIAAVQQVFKNLLISKVELRSENSLDVLPYIHAKAVEKMVVDVGNSYLKSIYDKIMMVFQQYSGKLLKIQALTGRDGYSYTHFQLLNARETFRKGLALKLPSYQKGFIENDFAICMSLAHAMEILLSHGLRTFYIYLQGVFNKEKGSPAVTAELRKNTELQSLLDEIKEKLSISVANSTFEMDLTSTSGIFDQSFNQTFGEKNIDYTLSHPKLTILKNLVEQHFVDYSIGSDTTRVMIFSQYRDSVQEIGNMLNSLRPMVKPIVFIGQSSTGTTGKGLKQKDQVQVVQRFRDGGFNVLVSTCVGEEGLDIGEVDLIICFDASSSPTRLIQRMGRTGRQRAGKTIFLLTKGKEEEKYRKSFSQHSSISNSINDPKKLQPYLYKFSPRMVPVGVEPTCYKMSVILSSEQNSTPAIVNLDEDDDDVEEEFQDRSKVKGKNETKKSAPTKRTRETSKTTKKSGVRKKPGHTITKMFEEVEKKVSQAEVVQTVTVPDPVISDLPNMDYEELPYDYQDDSHNALPDIPRAYQRDSIFVKIFDMEKERRTEWKPCVSFAKSSRVSTYDVLDIHSVEPQSILLDEQELAEVEFNVKSRASFSNNASAYCGCGNLREEYFTATIDSDGSSVAFLDRTVDNSSLVVPSQSSSPKNPSFQAEEEDSSDSLNEFPPSPETKGTGFLSRLLEQKAKSRSTIPVQTSKIKCYSATVPNPSPQPTNEWPTTSVDQAISQSSIGVVKKFKFRKKGFEDDTQQSQSCTTTWSNQTTKSALPGGSQTFTIQPQSEVEPTSVKSLSVRKSRPSAFNLKITSEAENCSPVTTFRNQNSGFTSESRIFTKRYSDISEMPDSPPSLFDVIRASSNQTVPMEEDQTESMPAPALQCHSNVFQMPEPLTKGLKIEDTVRKSPSTVSPKNPAKQNKVFAFKASAKPTTSGMIQGISPIRSLPSDASPGIFKSPHAMAARPSRFSPFNKSILSSASSSSVSTSTSRSRLSFIDKSPPRNRRTRNPFIESEAEVSGDESEQSFDDGDMNDFEGLDDFDDSFVTVDDSFTVSDSQQVRYLESVKDAAPVGLGRVEKPLSPRTNRVNDDGSGESYYEEDSICQEEVEYMDVGVFTQAMNAAVVDLALNGPSQGRQTRRAKREALNSAEDAKQSKQRRRIVMMEDSSDED